MIHRRALLAAAVLSGATAALQAQVNGYAEVTAIAGTTITLGVVDETNDSFTDGEELILMQMQDDVVGGNLANNVNFGNLASINSAGYWERVNIVSHTEVGGIPTSITIAASVTHVYHFGPKCSVQLITFPQRGTPDFTTTAQMNAVPWNGTIGGVLAFQVTGVFTMAHDLRADGAGFRGGSPSADYDGACVTTPYIASLSNYGEKGMGVQRRDVVNYQYARGKFATGGGGGNPDNAGGGGGGYITTGGGGGGGYGCVSGGLPGIELLNWIAADRFFMGGGGGGGQQNNGVGGTGGAGGGIIIISMETLRTVGPCPDLYISSNGADGGSSVGAPPDGAGGGGAGGTIYLILNSMDIDPTCTVTCQANGGNGGAVTNTDPFPGNWVDCGGGGGGGGQGLVICGGGAAGTGGNGGSGWAGFGGQTSSGSGGTHAPDGAHAPDSPGADGKGVLGFGNGPTLPVELLSFTGRPTSHGIQLDWSTATEHNSAGFRIHRSRDAHDWEQVNHTSAAGESLSTLYYTALDREPLPGLAYYQLEQYDLDGETEIFPMITVIWDQAIGMVAGPNPADDHLLLSASSEGGVLVTLTDATGRTVLRMSLATGERLVPLSSVASGTYRMSVTAGTEELLGTTVVVQH